MIIEVPLLMIDLVSFVEVVLIMDDILSIEVILIIDVLVDDVLAAASGSLVFAETEFVEISDMVVTVISKLLSAKSVFLLKSDSRLEMTFDIV
jgi:hypothetical protein